MKPYAQLRNQLIALVCLSVLGIAANWVYEYQLYIPSSATNRSTFESLPPEIGGVRYWGAGWPIKFFYETRYDGLPPLTLFSWSRLLLNLGAWLGVIAFFVLYESHLKKAFSRKTPEAATKTRLSVFDLLTLTGVIACAIVYWRWQEGISAAEGKLANEIVASKGAVSQGIFLPKRLQDLPDFIRLRFKRVVEVNMDHPTDALVERSLELPYLVRMSISGGNYSLANFAKLKQRPFLRSLRVVGRRVDPQFIGVVGSLHQLQVLTLSRTNITAKAIAAIGDLPRLRYLNFMHTDVKMSELGTPGFSKTLRFLETGHPENGQSDHLRLDNWPELILFSCSEAEIMESHTPVALELLNLPKLQKLSIDTQAVFDVTLDNLPQLAEIAGVSLQADRRFKPDGEAAVFPRYRKLTIGSVPKLARVNFHARSLEEVNFTSPCNAYFVAQVRDGGVNRFGVSGPLVIPKARVQQWVNSLASDLGPPQVSLSHMDFRGIDLSPFAKSPRLETLHIVDSRITHAQLLQLKGAAKLNTLGVDLCDLSGTAVAELIDSLPALRRIQCDARTVGRIKLANYPKLESLFGAAIIKVQPIEALHLEGLTSLPESFALPRELIYLHIDNMPAMTGLRTCSPWLEKAVFRGVRDLRVFSAGGPNLGNEVVEQLLNCPNLESLTLAHTSVTPEMLTKLGQFTKLKYLALSGSKVDDNVVAALTTLKQLHTLRLDYTPITDQAVDRLLTLDGLTHLDIGNSNITDEGLGKLADKKNLERLGCAGLPIGEKAHRALATLESLRALDLSSCKVQGTTLAALQGLRDLRLLNLSNADVHKRSLMDLARQLPDLKFIFADANIDQEAELELASVDRVVSVWNENPLLAIAMEVAQDRELIKAGLTHMLRGRATSDHPEVEPEMFAPNWTPPEMGPDSDPAGMMSEAFIRQQVAQQQFLEQRGRQQNEMPSSFENLTPEQRAFLESQAMQGLQAGEPMDQPMYTPMTFPEAIGYGLGQLFSELTSRSTTNE